ncbi:MAG: hypothetical protein ABSF22_21035 [Bryobacteraceae bacterium]|jgi:hypothetical protein
MKNVTDNQKVRKALGALFLAGGLFGSQAQAAIPAAQSTIPDRVAAVRAELTKRVAEAQTLGGHEALAKLPYTQMEVASWLNWVNWPNWNNWRDWNNWRNWSNWSNWFNY